MSECRNCGSRDLLDLGFVGEVNDFFLKRVQNLEVGFTLSANPRHRWYQRTIRSLFPGAVLSKILRGAVLVEVESCRSCSFAQTKRPFPEERLSRLYCDYRSASYNAERVRYEPSYAAIANQVGQSTREVESRVQSLTNWVKPRISHGDDFTMLDYGGADGKFLPSLDGKKYVYDISDCMPVPGVLRVPSAESLECYSYIQVCNVLEHVAYPLEMVKKVASHLRPGAYLYLEVPRDYRDIIRQLGDGKPGLHLPIHEHINFFDLESVKRLISAVGLEVVDVETEKVNVGWAASEQIRGLGRAAS